MTALQPTKAKSWTGRLNRACTCDFSSSTPETRPNAGMMHHKNVMARANKPSWRPLTMPPDTESGQVRTGLSATFLYQIQHLRRISATWSYPPLDFRGRALGRRPSHNLAEVLRSNP